MDTNILKEIGLTDGESKVYLALSKLGETTNGPITKESGVSSSKIYKIIDKLEIKGLVGKITKGKTTYYSALNPKQIIRYIENKEADLRQKKEEAKKLVEQLINQEGSSETTATVFQGFKAVTNCFLNIIDNLNSGDSYRVLGTGTYENVAGLKEFFSKYHTLRSDKKIKLEMLVNPQMELVKPTYKNANVKILPIGLDPIMQITIYKESVLIILWIKSPIAFLINNKEANISFNKYFNNFWKIC